MQDPEFEKQVRQKMQELRFAPGTDVWARVQADIRKKKRRRPLIIFLLLAGLMTGGAWLYFGVDWNGGNQQVGELNNKEQITNNKETEINNNNQTTPTQSNEATTTSTDKQDDFTNKNISNSDRNISKAVTTKDKNKKVASQIMPKNAAVKKISNKEDFISADVENKKTPENEESGLPTLKGNASYLEVTPPDRMKAKTTPSIVFDSANIKPADKKDLPLKPEELKKQVDSLAKKPFGAKTNNNKKKNWEWGVSAGPGYANAKSELSLVKSIDRLFSTAATRDSFLFSPDVKGSLAFNVGGYISKGINKRLRVKAGLNYEYYSTTMQVGSFVDSAKAVNQATGNLTMVDAYYRSGNQNKYTNAYHYVSLPVSIQWQVNRNAKRSIVWENGVSIARLVSTNALQYDPFSHSYYKDKGAQNKTQWMGSSSILFRVATKSNRHVYAGPQVQYAFTNLIKDADNKHLRYAGLKVMMSMNKN
jgi:hypothetical protein